MKLDTIPVLPKATADNDNIDSNNNNNNNNNNKDNIAAAATELFSSLNLASKEKAPLVAAAKTGRNSLHVEYANIQNQALTPNSGNLNNSHNSNNSNYEDQFLLPMYRAAMASISWDEDHQKQQHQQQQQQDRKPAALNSVLWEQQQHSSSSNLIADANDISDEEEPQQQQLQLQRRYRSVQDFPTTESLRQALSLCTVADNDNSHPEDVKLADEKKKKSTENHHHSHHLHHQEIDSTTPVVSSRDKNVRLKKGQGDADWLLPVSDPEAVPQTVEMELQRLLTLKSYLALDAEQERPFDQLCQEACREFQVPASFISLVDLGRQFQFAASTQQTKDCRSTPRRAAFCAHSILSRSGFTVVRDTLQDERFCQNPFVVEPPHLRFYAGAPLISPEGFKLGTFCVEGPEPKPHGLSQDQIQALQRYAQQGMALLVHRRQLLMADQCQELAAAEHAAVAAKVAKAATFAASVTSSCAKTSTSVPTSNSNKKQRKGEAASCSAPPPPLSFATAASSSSPQSQSQQPQQASMVEVEGLDEGGFLYSQVPRDFIGVGLLRKHAGITTNLGGILYSEGDCVAAMHLFQESVQTLMSLEAILQKSNAALPERGTPSRERHEEMAQLLTMLSAENNTPESRRAFCAITRQLALYKDTFANDKEDGRMVASSSSTFGNSSYDPFLAGQVCSKSTMNGFPGLYGHCSSKLRGVELAQLSGLVFAEPFKIDVHSVNNQETQLKHFIIPLEQCSKATLFNMGLVHYHWGRLDTAMQFFDLSSSMTLQLSPLAFDPVILAAFNNMAQIHLQFGRTGDAMELIQDAMTRGNAALAALYSDERAEWKAKHSTLSGQADASRSRRLRRKLARTVMNMGHVHYVNCEYEAAMRTCHDALRLLHPNTEDSEVAAVWHNMGILLYHQGRKEDACRYLEQFIKRGRATVGPNHLQLAEAYMLLGVAIFEMGKLYECMVPLNEALRIRQLRLGSTPHASVAESLCSIGRVLLAREEYDFCLKAFSEGMELHYQTTGPNGMSLETAQTLLDVGRAYHAQNMYVEAIATYEQVTVLTRRFFGLRSAFVARILIIKGNLHLELGQVTTAMDKFKEAMEIHLEQGLTWDYNVVKDPLCRVKFEHVPAAPMA